MLNRIASRLSQRLSMLTLAAVRTVSEPPREKAGELYLRLLRRSSTSVSRRARV